jgi:hypothetical protein
MNWFYAQAQTSQIWTIIFIILIIFNKGILQKESNIVYLTIQ